MPDRVKPYRPSVKHTDLLYRPERGLAAVSEPLRDRSLEMGRVPAEERA